MKYRKNPIEVEAFQLGTEKEPEWFLDLIDEGLLDLEVGAFIISTLEGKMRATRGMYIVKGIEGEVYPVKEEIFLKTYEKVKE